MYTLILSALFTVMPILKMTVTAQIPGILPGAPPGWKISEKDMVHTPENLFEYIDGGAELYLSYGFQKGYSRVYSSGEQPEIVVDVFDMGHPWNAFGVFSYSMDHPGKKYGQGSEVNEGSIIFRDGRYFISMLCYPETDESRKTMEYIANYIDQGISSGNITLPEVVTLLPDEGLIKNSIRYFHHHAWQNSHYFISTENILHIDHRVHAVSALYRTGQEDLVLTVIDYPDLKSAKSAVKDLRDHIFSGAEPGIPVQLADEKWSEYQLKDQTLYIVFNGKTAMMTRRFMESLLN